MALSRFLNDRIIDHYRQQAIFYQLMQCELLNSHIGDLTHKQVVFAATVDCVDRAKLLRQFPCFAELADDGPVQFHLVDLTGHVEIFRWI